MTTEWLDREALIIVKAYPNPSAKYHETVCVAAITREEGLIRLYPVGFRSLPEDQRFKKYQLVKLRMQRHDSDRRPESFRPDEHSIELGNTINTSNSWRQRWMWIRPVLGTSMCDLLRQQDEKQCSLGLVKPVIVEDFTIEDADPEWSGGKKAEIDQLQLFDPVEEKLEKIPFVFRYRYRCESPDCKGHHQSILDWELMELYRKERARLGIGGELKRSLRNKYLGELCSSSKDTHFFVGNHSRYPSSFMVLGVFWPPKSDITSLF